MLNEPLLPAAAAVKAAPPMEAGVARTRDICKTLLAIGLVCLAMPFVTMTQGELSHTVSLWQLAARLQRLELVKALPDTAHAMILMARMMGWAVMALLAGCWLVVLTRYRRSHFPAVMAACFAALLLELGLYFYLRYLLGPDTTLTFGNGAVALLAATLLTSLTLLTMVIRRRTALAVLLILLVIPATIAFGILFLGDRKYYIVSLLVIVETMLPFFMVFEQRQPQARELILIAVMAAIAVVGRAAFYMLPAFKPLVAIVIIAGVSLGPEAGFLVGALAGFVSNFLFGQGPWTPWQMFAFGICGFLAGLLFRRLRNRAADRPPRCPARSRLGRKLQALLHDQTLWVAVFGGVSIMLICGPLLDLCSYFTMAMQQTPQMFWAILLSGIPYNAVHATATVLFILLLAKPMNRKLDRIKQKYGLMDP